MRKHYIIRVLVFLVIFLFIATAFNPIINANVTDTISKNKYTNFIVTANGVKGFNPKLVKLSYEQVCELDDYFDFIKSKLENSTTSEEITNILIEAVFELDKYGLLPERMSIEKAQQLIINKYQKTGITNKLVKESENFISGDKENFDCQIVGKTYHNIPFDYKFEFRKNLWLQLMSLFQGIENLYLALFLILLVEARVVIFLIRCHFLCLIRESKLSFGSYYYSIDPDTWEWSEEYTPDSGWVWTKGTNGEVSWEGSFWGLISQYWEYFLFYDKWCYFIGVEGFTGFRIISLSDHRHYFFGLGSHVKFGPNCPYP